ncbi:transcription factor atoh7 [Paramormyrops kingsleyae]|uniref:transcription factor atoh7 n=1 Tax=Paramormyrops kingsleyae TaxID=1676925 RepID=UPI000CD61C74|nr:protein atonal homolog 7 [Paramormyrops kingsleyae]
MKSYQPNDASCRSESEPKGAQEGHSATRRRIAANARERKRMLGLNSAFEQLRGVVPRWGQDKKLSKYETLQMALSYILALSRILTEPRGRGAPQLRLGQHIENQQPEHGAHYTGNSSPRGERSECIYSAYAYQCDGFYISG